MKSWILKCNVEHKSHCQSSNKQLEDEARPSWLVNVEFQHLEPARSHHQYTALSYVWGKADGLCASKSNIKILRTPASLTKRALPRTIQRAMELTRRFGLKHLWVDRLCILQDDNEAKVQQIHNMASIYANAYLKIVAAAGAGADWGMEGLFSRDIYNTVSSSVENQQAAHAYARRIHEALLINSPWVTRGWTMQELVFSRRVLFVWNKNLTWECHCATWHPSTSAASNTTKCRERIIEGSGGLQSAKWPDLEEYSRLVTDYSGRNLTDSRDTVYAFAGVCSILSRAFLGGFLYGLPEMFIDIALLWQPLHTISAKRGLRTPHTASKQDSIDCIPTWSWMAWEGPVNPNSWACGYDYVHKTFRGQRRRWKRWKPTTWKIRSTITWYGRLIGSPERRQILCTAWRYRAYSDPACKAIIPRGWHVFTDEREQEKPLFKHHSDTSTIFKYPVTVNEPSSAPQLTPQLRILCGKTRRAYLALGSSHLTRPDRLTATLRDSKGAWAGILRLHERTSAGAEGLIAGYLDNSRCELIEISAGSAQNNSDESQYLEEWQDRYRPRSEEFYEVYNVLWVEWNDGIARWKALGRVIKTLWDEEARETIEVVIG
jgi:hypothetical protein